MEPSGGKEGSSVTTNSVPFNMNTLSMIVYPTTPLSDHMTNKRLPAPGTCFNTVVVGISTPQSWIPSLTPMDPKMCGENDTVLVVTSKACF